MATKALPRRKAVNESADLRIRMLEAEQTLRAIRAGEVDALVVGHREGAQAILLKGADNPYRAMVESMNEGAVTVIPDGSIFFCNPRFSEMVSIKPAQLVGSAFQDLIAPNERGALLALLKASRRSSARGEFHLQTMTGTPLAVQLSVRELKAEGMQGSSIVVTDLTERKLAEQTLRDSETRFRALIEHSGDAILLVDADANILYRSPAAYRMLGREPGAARDALLAAVHPEDLEEATNQFARVLKGPDQSVPFRYRVRHADGSWRWVEGTATNLLPVPAVAAVVLNYRDITEKRTSEERIKRQLEHLTAVSAIDRTIAASLDLHLSLSTVVSHVIQELLVDAADILLLDPASQVLVYAAGSGFRTECLKPTRLPLGQGYAGKAGLERRLVRVKNLPLHESEMSRAPGFKAEEFETYFALPLVAKGKLVGVMEAFKRTAFEPDLEWLDFLNTLGGQAAVAIDALALFENLQRSIVDLSVAYDATIAGWSSAMDLRDKETEGHTQRVTEMCVNLARRFGMKDPELAQVRRGGLLHDMGKMGIPDSILLKPGPLTDEEWVVMKKHPVYAFEMLSPIPYLRAALDIPYCHHEKWDGTGYPRGLKGEQIPLAARLFAVVDVWDALTSDRPYRKAWTREKTLEHIRAGAGTHFDPQVVKIFLESDSLRTTGVLSARRLEPGAATT